MNLTWPILVLIGAPLNALNNMGYKMLSAGDNIFIFTAALFVLASFIWFSYGVYKVGQIPQSFFTPKILILTFIQGLFSTLIMILFISAFQHGGPISLVDPLLACVYSLTSIAIGVGLMRENPGSTAYVGIAAYLSGAALMIFG